MRHTFNSNRFKSIVWVLIIILLSGCGEYFEDPLKDKETGEDLNLLIIDFNFFKTSMTYKLLDASDGSQITQQAQISFTGQNKSDIVTFAGEKKENFQTSVGQLELTIDPNVSISASTPFEFAVNVNIEGYNTLAKGIQIQTEGKKTFELYLSKIKDEVETDIIGEIDFFGGSKSAILSNNSALKSTRAEVQPYTIRFSVSVADLLEFEDANGRLFSTEDEIIEAYNNSKIEGIPFIIFKVINSFDFQQGIDVINIDGVKRNVLFQILESGNVNRILILGKEVTKMNNGEIRIRSNYVGDEPPALFGFVEFENSCWNVLGDDIIHDELKQSYTLAKVIEDTVCETGGSISFSSNMKSSFSIDADLYDLNDKFITSMSFKGDFPETFILENIPQMPLKMVFRNNNPAFAPIAPIEANDLCNGNHEIEVRTNDEYVEYQIVLKALCADNPTIAIAPTYSAEIKLKNSDNPWQGITMSGGIVNVLGKINQEYQLRLLWEDQWEYSTYFTEFDNEGNYLGKPEAGAKIKSEFLEDGRIRINIENIFSQSICNDLGW
ncbi:MAG: hypothetical protein HQ522_20760 [Bacteroidetes bacterium]|nr:hypothetical protein [Bacteroidota bacterium]